MKNKNSRQQKFFKKSYKKHGRVERKKTKAPKSKNKYMHMARNHESEEYLKRVRAAEQKQEKRRRSKEETDSEGEIEQDDTFQQLIQSLSKNEKKSLDAIESDESSDEEDDEEEEEMEGDDTLNLDEDIKEPSLDQDNDMKPDEEVPEEVEEGDAEEEEDGSDVEVEQLDMKSSSDPFSIHFDNELSPSLLDAVSVKNYKKTPDVWPQLGTVQFELPICNTKEHSKPKGLICLDEPQTFAKPGIVPNIAKNLDAIQIKNQILEKVGSLNNFQMELLTIVGNYQDVYFSQRNFENCEDIRKVYCLHALNHALKTRARVLHHNARLNRGQTDVILPDYFRDQGLTRPKVLIICPFRDSAYKVINVFIQLFSGGDKSKIMNYAKFVKEFTGEELFFSKRNPKPEDYEKTFSGNINDHFRIGIALTKKNLKLYTDFYGSDIIIASPVGLRNLIGAKGEEQDYDFLSSIEVLILDQAELFFAQNWEHLILIFDHLHLKPTEMRGADLTRVRNWVLAGISKHYCQTMLFTSHELPEFRNIYNQKMANYRGKARTAAFIESGSIRHVMVQTPQIFQRIEAASLEQSMDARFDYFVKNVLPQYKSPSKAHCLIYVPSYFDYIRLKNYFKQEDVNFVQIYEYSKDDLITRARDKFFHSAAHFLLYTERAHFFRRMRIKGIRNIIFYAPPAFPNFYSEILNFMVDSMQNSRDGCENTKSVTVLYTKYDLLQVAAIIGTDRAAKISAPLSKKTHMFMTNGTE